MVDVNFLLRKYLLSQVSVTGLLGTNVRDSIYSSPDIPEKVNAALGPFIQIFRSGGSAHEEVPPLVTARMQVRAWAGIGQEQLVRELYSSIFDVLHGATGLVFPEGVIMSALEVTGPQEMTDPDTRWVAVNSFYSVMARPN